MTAANQLALHSETTVTPLPFDEQSFTPPVRPRELDSVTKRAKAQRRPEADAEQPEDIDPRVLEKLQKLRQSAKNVQDMIRDMGGDATAQPTQAESTEPVNELPEIELSNVKGKSLIDSIFDFGLQIFKKPDTFVQRYSLFAKELMEIVQSKSTLQPERGDRRFRDAVWQDNPVYRMMLQTYLSWSKHMQGLVEDLQFEDEYDQRRANFILNQLTAALSPSNSPLNPTAVKRAYQTGGQSVVMGLQNLLRDVLTNSGMPRQVSKDAYQVGTDLGNNPGTVVYRSRVFELIQYSCADREKVYQRPALIVPPQINKFYIFDLTPKNSIVKHLLDSGMQVFIISWKNPQPQHADWGLETYIKEMEKGIDAILDITGSRDINLVSACAGGITSMALQAYYANKNAADKKSKVIRNHSVLVTAFSADDHPTLDLFLNKESLQHTLARTQSRGLMDGKELAHVFAWLRPTDLVWNYWVNNNLLGKEPPTMDVLFWDNDSTRLPAALHRDFIDVLLNNRFVDNQGFTIDGKPLSLDKVRGDFYFLAGDEDYLMPWKNCYKNLNLLPKASCEFVLSNSGHIQSVLRPPGIGNTHYYTNSNYQCDANSWLDSAETHKGSWWGHWSDWLTSRSGRQVKAPEFCGSENYPPICASPGTYVLEK